MGGSLTPVSRGANLSSYRRCQRVNSGLITGTMPQQRIRELKTGECSAKCDFYNFKGVLLIFLNWFADQWAVNGITLSVLKQGCMKRCQFRVLFG